MSDATKPYGLWPSPISADDVSGDLRFGDVGWHADGETMVWMEGRSGRGVLVTSRAGDAARDHNRELDVRAEVGYGGGDFAVAGDDVFFAVRKSGRLYRQPIGPGTARPITPAWGSASDPQISADGRWLAYVHHAEGNDRIAIVDAAGNDWPQVLAQGHDFYMQPRFSPDGKRFAFIAWDHPLMPWDGSTLYIGALREAGGPPRLEAVEAVAGGTDVAVFQPELLADGSVLYISDETGWGQLWRFDAASGERTRLSEDGVEYGAPAWVQGVRTYARLPEDRAVVAIRNERGFNSLERIDLSSGDRTAIPSLYTTIDQIAAAPVGERIAFVGSAPQVPPRVLAMDLERGSTRVVARASTERVPVDALASCEAMQWESAAGETAHGLLYRPAGDGVAPAGEKPPLIVFVHGGPTSQVRAGWDPRTQYFATRGYAVLWVNYRGSTGYGREYMLKLREAWGVADVEDCASAVRGLAARGEVDEKRCVIAGGSAGGYTVLQALIHAPESFAAGLDYYGVANMFSLARDTHKFESRYLDSMIGPLPEQTARYRERSPLFSADRIKTPVAVFQGDEDKVVPKNQSDQIVAALRRNAVPHAYHVYEGEGHGFRQQKNLRHFYRSMEEFLQEHVLFA